MLPKDEGIEFDPEENGSSYIENAVIKAEALYRIVHAPVLADDSGLQDYFTLRTAYYFPLPDSGRLDEI